ncbi:polysaccharide deacetylase family protein [Halobacteriovorax sp.]|uniref:polysaccharide deacetylase family protein n=1 Tax=Halobacteriovorax sp. TaxID=2020862 RepID=UPI00356A85B3
MKFITLLLVILTFSQLEVCASPGHSHQKDLDRTTSYSVYPGKRKVVLTIDDGPSPKATPQILETLRQYNIKATFFVLGKNALKYPELTDEIRRDGHIVANHSYKHENFSKFSRFFMKRELKQSFFGAHSALVPYSEGAKHFYFRAPGGAWQSKAAKVINKTKIGKSYIGPVYWDIGGEVVQSNNGKYLQAADWNCWSKKMSVDQCLEGYMSETNKKNGGVILMHDIHNNSAKLLKKLIPSLIEESYEFISLDDAGLK